MGIFIIYSYKLVRDKNSTAYFNIEESWLFYKS